MQEIFEEIRKSMKHAKILYCPTCRIQCDPKSGYCAKCGLTNLYEWAEGYTKAILDFNIFPSARPENFEEPAAFVQQPQPNSTAAQIEMEL